MSGIVQVYNPGCITPSMAMPPFRLCKVGYREKKYMHIIMSEKSEKEEGERGKRGERKEDGGSPAQLHQLDWISQVETNYPLRCHLMV
jgi:hypothetical protein